MASSANLYPSGIHEDSCLTLAMDQTFFSGPEFNFTLTGYWLSFQLGFLKLLGLETESFIALL